jgi:hypothetical protein
MPNQSIANWLHTVGDVLMKHNRLFYPAKIVVVMVDYVLWILQHLSSLPQMQNSTNNI